MNKNAIGIAVAVVVVIGGLAAWAFTRPASPAEKMMGNGMMENGGPQSLKELLTGNRPQTCTFSQADAQAGTQGTVYIANAMMRGDFTSIVNGQTFMSHMLVKGNELYTWTDGTPMGMKMMMDAETEADTTESTQQQAVDLDAELNYDCSNWTADQNKFELPSGVNFQSFGELMMPKAGMNLNASGSATPPSANCSICDSVPAGESRDQCRSALGC